MNNAEVLARHLGITLSELDWLLAVDAGESRELTRQQRRQAAWNRYMRHYGKRKRQDQAQRRMNGYGALPDVPDEA